MVGTGATYPQQMASGARMKPLKIAIISVDPAPTLGWGRYAYDLIGALNALNVEIRLITERGAKASDLNVKSVHRVLPSLSPAPRWLSARLLLARPQVIQACRGCDAVFVTAEPYAILAPPDIPLIVTAHGTYLPVTAKHRLLGGWYRAVYRRAQIVCVSHYTEQRVQAAIAGLHTVVIPNGVNSQRYRALPADIATFRERKTAPTILAVGQVKPRKGIRLLIEALALVKQQIHSAELAIIGSTSDNNHYRELTARVEALGLEPSVRFLGRVPDTDLLAWYHTADVFALPSLNVGDAFEGFGLVYLEASAAGLPVVGNDGCGAEDAIRDGETGFLVPQGDITALAESLVRLLNDSALRDKLGAAGQTFAAAHTWDRAAREMLALLKISE